MLTLEQQREAYRQGLMMYDEIERRRRGRHPRFRHDRAKQRAICGESQVAEALCRDELGLPPVTPLLEPDEDVGDAVGGWEFKWTARPNGCLLVRLSDNPKPHFKYMLVTGNAPNQVIRGWLAGYEVMVDRWWRGDAWFVPQSELLPL